MIWALVLFVPFLRLVGLTITWMGLPNPMDIDHSAGLEMTGDEEMASLYGISMLHTLFNLFNTMILIWFVPVIVKIVENVIKGKAATEEESVKLKFIDAGPLSPSSPLARHAMRLFTLLRSRVATLTIFVKLSQQAIVQISRLHASAL